MPSNMNELSDKFSFVNQVRVEPYPTDRFLNKIILPLIPRPVRPNHLTFLRLILTPLVLYFLWQGNFILGLTLFLIAALTDALDGAMARLRSQITVWGIIYDPVADKVLIGGAVLVLLLKVHFFLALAVVFLELITVLGAFYFKNRRNKLCPANVWGKTKMVLQVAAVVFLILGEILGFPGLLSFSFTIFYFSLFFSVISVISRSL